MRWRLIGSFRGGRVTAVAGVSDNPNVYYFGTPGGGIWKTTDAGQVWKPIFDQERVASIGALAVAPSDSKTIYAGTGEQIPGKGVYKSRDEGATWTHVGLENTRFIQAVIVDPRNPDIVIAGANSIGVSVFSRPSPTDVFSLARGIFKTTDGGKTWKQTLSNNETAGVFDLAVDPDNPRVLYASLYIPASGPVPSATEKGGKKANSLIYKSIDEGNSWNLLVSKGLPEDGRGRLGISVAPNTRGQRLYAIMEQGFYRSDDSGTTWTQSTKDPRIEGDGYFSRVFIDTKNPDILYVAQTSLYRSIDGGHTFAALVGAPSGDDFHVLWIDPKNPSRMLLGVDQGAILTVDAGKTWSSWYNQPTGQYYHVITDNAFPYRVYAPQQDSGTQSVPSRSDNGEITPQDVTSIGGFEFCYIAPDPLHPDWIYSGGWYGSVVRYDRANGQVATVFEKGDRYRVVQMPPLLFSSPDPNKLYLGTQYVLQTTDQGQSWHPVSPDLTEWDNVDLSEKDPDKPRPPAIEALAVSPIDANEMWVATSNRLVQLTKDGGDHWQEITPPGLAVPYQLLYVEPSHHDPATAFLTVGPGRESVPPQILRTRDLGATWQSIINGLPADQSVRVVREDTVRRGLLFAGTDSTVFLSFDDGDHWRPLTLNLPVTPVTDMEIHGDDLVISTFGRSLWILDNIRPIRQLTPEVLADAVHLFAPATALRVRWDTFQDTPLPIETPTGQNPPDGIGLDYYLNTALTDEPSITIRDASGNIVRKFTGTGHDPDLPLPNVPEYWFATPPSVEKTPGLHRFVWDLRYPPPHTLPASYWGPIIKYTEYTLADHAIPYETPRQQPQGPLVVPGTYTVEFSAGGRTVKQSLTVKLDPRVQATQADLEAQLALSRRIIGGMEVSYQEFQKLKPLTDAVEARKKKQRPKTNDKTPGNATDKTAENETDSTTDDTKDIEKQIKAIEDGSKTAPGLGRINRDLTRLLDGVVAADQRPTDPQIAAVNQVCDSFAKVITLWQALNENLKKQNPLNLPIATDVPTAGCPQ